jgi:hypothetical protein
MGRPDFNPLLSFSINPPIESATTREDDCVFAVRVEDGKLKVLIEWRGRDGLPHLRALTAKTGLGFDSDQEGPLKFLA